MAPIGYARHLVLCLPEKVFVWQLINTNPPIMCSDLQEPTCLFCTRVPLYPRGAHLFIALSIHPANGKRESQENLPSFSALSLFFSFFMANWLRMFRFNQMGLNKAEEVNTLYCGPFNVHLCGSVKIASKFNTKQMQIAALCNTKMALNNGIILCELI